MTLSAVFLSSMALCLAAGLADGGEKPPVDTTDRVASAATIRFHRIMVPAERMKDWPLGGERYLPMDADEFERLIEALKPEDINHPIAPSSIVISANYSARLDAARLIGKAVLEVVLAGDRPAVLSLDPIGMAIGSAHWRSDSEKIPAVLGSTADGKLVVLVEKSGRLEFDWSLAAKSDLSDVSCFAFELPTAASNRFSLELPEDTSLSVDRGVVIGGEPSGERSRRWRIELGRTGRFNLHVIPAGTEIGRPLALLRESRTYDCSPRGLELSVQWKLHVHNDPLEQVVVSLDPGLRLVSASLGETAIPWSIIAAEHDETQIKLRLPEPIRDAERSIRLTAIGPMELGRIWHLPRIRSTGLLWQEGGITLLTSDPLAADRIEPIGCVQTGAGRLSAPRSGLSAQFQCFDSDATVEVLMSLPLENAKVAPIYGDDGAAELAKIASQTFLAGSSTTSYLDPSYAGPVVRVENGKLRLGDRENKSDAEKELQATRSNVEPTAWAWNMQLESWYQRDAEARHLAVYDLRNVGRNRMEFTLPPEIDRENVRGVWIGSEPVFPQFVERNGNRLMTVELPAEKEHLRLSVEWTVEQPPLGFAGVLGVVVPEPNIPLLARNWNVRLPPGWSISRMNRAPLSPLTLRCVRRNSTRLFGLIAFILVASLGCWRKVKHQIPPVALGIFATAAVFIPAAYLPVAWGGAGGAVFAMVWRWMRCPARKIAREQQPRRPSNSDSTIAAAWPLGGLLFVAMIPIVARAAAMVAEIPAGEDAASTTYRVFVPIDSQRKPVGGKVFVPESFYRRLHQLAAAAGKPPGWLFLGANYRGELTREAGSGRMTAGTLRVQYDLRVFEPDARVVLPLGGEGATLLPGTVLLDGRPIETDGKPDSPPTVRLSEPGRYRLELAVRPTTFTDGASVGFELAIPRVPAARLELSLPKDASSVEAPSARGGVALGEGSRMLKAELGPADRLTVRWPEKTARGGGPIAEVEQLTWLKVQPGSVLLALKLKFHSIEGRLRQIRLAVDPRLRLLPLEGDDPPSVQLGPEAGNLRTLTFRWSRPIAAGEILEATMLLGGASGVGNVPLPKIESLDFQPVRKWIAFSVDPTLDYDQQIEASIEPVEAADFLQAWGAADQPPLAAFRPTEEQNGWTLSTKPHQPRGTAAQSLTLCFDADHVDALFEASIAVASGYIFQHRLTAPKNMEVENVSVLEEGIERVERWARNDKGTITVFLGGPASGSQQLVLRGRMPIEMGRHWRLPEMRVRNCDLSTATIRLLRRPDVLLEVEGEEGEQLIMDDVPAGVPKAPDTQRRFAYGRLARTIRWDGVDRPPADVIAIPNCPNISAEEVLHMRENDHRWYLRAEYRMTVADGLLDEIQILAPAAWVGPFQVDQPGELQIREQTKQGRLIVFRPREPISAEFSFAVTGLLESPFGARPSVPDVRPLGINHLKRFVILPLQNGNRSYRWLTRGLNTIEISTGGRPPTETARRYEVLGEQFQARLESIAVDGVVGSVTSAEVVMAWQSDGLLRGAAVFDVIPDGVARRTLRLPDGCELVQATVAGSPVSPQRIDDNLWRLALLSADEPQRLEVVFRGRFADPNSRGRHRFDAPTLNDTPTPPVRWTIVPPAGMSVSDPQGAVTAEPWRPGGVLQSTIGASRSEMFQYESTDGDATLSLYVRAEKSGSISRYFAAIVALAAFAFAGRLFRGRSDVS